jgi:hypothetical protein
MVCKYYDKKYCSKNCKQDWVKCDICGEYLDLPMDESKMNGYSLDHTRINCDFAQVRDETVMVICEKCFNDKIKPLKEESE